MSDEIGLAARLVETALALLAQDGTDAVSLRAVARAAGVSAMAPYRHFPDKESLLAAVATRGFEALRRSLLAADEAGAPGDRLVALAVGYVGFAVDNPALFRLMFGPPRAGCHPQLEMAGNSAFDVLAARVAAEAGPEAGKPLTLGCWALVHGLALLWLDGHFDASVPAADLTRQVARAMLAAHPIGDKR